MNKHYCTTDSVVSQELNRPWMQCPISLNSVLAVERGLSHAKAFELAYLD